MNACPGDRDQLGAEVQLAAGKAVIHKGDAGVAVCIILAGEVEVSLGAEEVEAWCQLSHGTSAIE